MAFRKMPMMAIITLAIVGLLLTLTTMVVLGTPRGSGGVRAISVGVYSDSGCTINCTFINWENVSPGSTTTETIYIKNTGNTVMILEMSTSNWSPRRAKSLLTLSWNLSSYSLPPGMAVPAVLALVAASDTGSLTNFNFAITITGTQQKN